MKSVSAVIPSCKPDFANTIPSASMIAVPAATNAMRKMFKKMGNTGLMKENTKKTL